MGLRFFILNKDYGEFLIRLYGRHPRLETAPYTEQLQVRMESLFGVADFYSSNLRRLGHEAWDVHANNEFMQKAWAKEHGVYVDEPVFKRRRMQKLLWTASRRMGKMRAPLLKSLWRSLRRSVNGDPKWFYDIIVAQIKEYKPDILLNQAMDEISSRFLREIKPHVRLLVGQIASPLPVNEDFSVYDLVVSSLPNFVAYFLSKGLPAALHRFAFEPRVLGELNNGGQQIPVSFAGSLSEHHRSRLQLLEYLCARQEVKVWGPGADRLSMNSSVHRSYMGQVWGCQMYEVLRRSQITLNHHIGVASCYANNMRLFEATGVGALLLTDWKKNLADIFEPGKEVLSYRTPEECLELVKYYLEHEEARSSIARAGQQRTLREHNYYQRMEELVEIVRKYL